LPPPRGSKTQPGNKTPRKRITTMRRRFGVDLL